MHTDSALLAEAGKLLTDRGLIGLIWLDETLVVSACIGALASEVVIGAGVGDSVLALVGLEDELLAMKARSDSRFDLPNMRMGDGDGPRINLSVFWQAAEHRYVVLLALVLTRSDVEIELAEEMRRRLIAESALQARKDALDRTNGELTRANRDLAEFAYVVSHDLRAPLRAMRYFVDDIQKALAIAPEPAGIEDARGYLVRLHQQVRRMGSMLTALLEYARVGRKDEVVARVDTHKLATEIAATVGAGRGIEIEIIGQDWPTLRTLEAPLDLVLRNLIENAVKHHDRAEGRVLVTADDAGEAWRFSVCDDGPGIAQDWHEAVFMPFRTIKETEGTENCGIGLALVKKTAEIVGGAVELVSDPRRQRGARFTVVWPKAIKTCGSAG